MSGLLKGNFKTKKEVTNKPEEGHDKAEGIAQQLKKAALNSIGGSMVYVERTELTWDGKDEE